MIKSKIADPKLQILTENIARNTERLKQAEHELDRHLHYVEEMNQRTDTLQNAVDKANLHLEVSAESLSNYVNNSPRSFLVELKDETSFANLPVVSQGENQYKKHFHLCPDCNENFECTSPLCSQIRRTHVDQGKMCKGETE